MEDAKTTLPCPELASAPDGEVPRMVKTPEQAERVKQHAEVIEHLDAMNASLQQLISLLSQAKEGQDSRGRADYYRRVAMK